MTKELSDTYDASKIEQPIYEWWESEGYFTPEKQAELGLVDPTGPRFSITIPPPNVTGALHLGHAIVVAIEDLMARYNRMLGRQTLYVPGSDHAGIATQNVVERELRKKGIHRKDLGREKFVEEVWQWKRLYHARITEQTKRLGVSCDWTREAFTLDEERIHAVRTTFVHLFKKGLIYRGPRLINWCPRCESAISDLEAVPEDKDVSLFHIRYPIISNGWTGPQGEWGSGNWAVGATEFIEVATTRPETLLGDTAVATHFAHERFGRLIGGQAVLPVLGRRIPIIADEMVDPTFGTGAVKVTPAHDPNDYETGKRHGLEEITVMDERAQMNEAAGPYAGLDRFDARKKLVADLQKEGLLIKTEPYRTAIAQCQRCSTIIEPRISTQWFVNTGPLAARAIEAVEKGETIIIPRAQADETDAGPKGQEKRFFDWMKNIHDWCISRQLWWGHRIPVWYCDNCGRQTCEMTDPVRCAHCDSRQIRQDEDVLDTWFSSSLWPFSTLGWPDESKPDYRRYYPTDMRETGYDILFFWVAREMMMGIELTGKSPYSVVYLHGIVRDQHGKKISKSMEEEELKQYDPLRIILTFGADALRYTLITSSTPGLDTNLDPTKLEGAKRFCNKIWQATRLVLTNIKETPARLEEISPEELQPADRWILSRLSRLTERTTELFNNFQYGEAGRQINEFFWEEFCAWYIEFSKVRLYRDDASRMTPLAVLIHVSETCLRLLHPFMPYITEALWQSLPEGSKAGPALIIARWPEADRNFIDDAAEDDFEIVKQLVSEIRKLRADYDIKPGQQIAAQFAAGDKLPMLESSRDEIIRLCKLDPASVVISDSFESHDKAIKVVAGSVEAYIPKEALLHSKTERLRKELEEVEGQITELENRLTEYLSTETPRKVVQHAQNRLVKLKAKTEQINERLAELSA